MLKFSGNGSAFNTVLGNNSAYIKNGNHLFMIDCGSSTFSTIKESGLLDDVENIDVFITHTHADHVGSLADLIFYMYYCKGEFKSRVTVYSVKDINIYDYLLSNGVTTQKYNNKELSDMDMVYIEELGLRFITFKTSHVEELNSYGLFINFDYLDKTVAYSGDTNNLPSEINDLLEKNILELLYVDTCSQDYEGNVHLSLYKLTQLINEQNRHKVWCMHLDEQFDKQLAMSLGFNVTEVEL